MGSDDASFTEMHRAPVDPDADPLALDDAAVERLLAGDLPPEQAPPGYAEVARLLAATTAAPGPEELAGQEAALAELRAATRARRAAVRRARTPRRRRRVGLAAVAVAGALATGGAAAAATDHLPGPVRNVARSILVTVGGATPVTPTRTDPPPAPTAGPGGAAPGSRGAPPSSAAGLGPRPTAAAGTDPGIAGLCQAYLAGEGTHGKKLDATAFGRLAEAAGGPGKVADYCQAAQPGAGKPKQQKQKEPPDDHGQGNGGPPTSTGGGNQGQGGQNNTQPPRR